MEFLRLGPHRPAEIVGYLRCCYNDQVKVSEVGGVCSTDDGVEKCTHRSWLENLTWTEDSQGLTQMGEQY